MKIQSVTIRNVMGLEELTIQPGHLTIIEGRNGVGKTSVLAALRDVFSGGHDPTLIRVGADQAEIEITLADGVTISKVIRPGKSTLEVRHPQFGKVSKPQAFINELVNTLSVDPVLFLTQKPKDRLATLLEAMPLRITADQIGFLPVKMVKSLDLDRHALEILGDKRSGLFGALYDERTGLNKAAKEKRATASEMSRALPAEPENGDWRQTYESAQQKLAQLNWEARSRIQEAKGYCARNNDSLEKSLQAKIEELRAQAASDKATNDARRDASLAELQAEYTPNRDSLTAKMAEAQTMLEQSARADEGRKLVARLQSEAATLEKSSDALSKAMDKLQDLKSDLLETTPIKGVTIQDGDLFVDGVVFDRVNEARRIQIALEVARIRAGELPLVLVDDAEHFDSLNMKRFREAAAKAGLQIIAAKVSDADLTVAAEGGAHVA